MRFRFLSRKASGAILCLLLTGAIGQPVAAAYRFNAQGVLDLSSPDLPRKHPAGREIPRGELDPRAAEAILRQAAVEPDSPAQLPLLGVEDKQARSQERLLIAPQRAAVQRSGKRLTITPASGKTVTFTDWAAPSNPRGEGDGERFLYAGRLNGSGYHRVEVQYQQDSPGAFLVNPESGKMAYAHNGSDAVVLSPGGAKVLAFDTLNPPFVLAVARLVETGPTLALLCRFTTESDRIRGHASFFGWRGENAFEVQFAFEANSTDRPAALPARVEMIADHWQVLAPTARLQRELPGFSCQEFGAK